MYLQYNNGRKQLVASVPMLLKVYFSEEDRLKQHNIKDLRLYKNIDAQMTKR